MQIRITLDRVLVDDWRRCWRWISTWMLLLLGAWLQLSPEDQAAIAGTLIPADLVPKVLAWAALAGRLVRQSHPDDAP